MSRSRIRRALARMIGPPTEPFLEGSLDAALVTPDERAVLDRVQPISITSNARLLTLMDAVRYCVERPVEGAFAECGVWRGGSILAMVMTLQNLGREDRDVYLYDTFEGMTKPTEVDTSPVDRPALETWNEANARNETPWAHFFADEAITQESVQKTVTSSGYPDSRIHLVRGAVEETLPNQAPNQLALLRLDTDWYESTRHELEHLYPRLASGGVLIIDDYGHWEGARKAVDEYFSRTADPILLTRVDYTARMGVKL